MSYVAKYFIWLVGPLIFLWLATTSLSELIVGRAIDVSYDEKLGDFARSLAGELQPAPGGGVTVPASALALLRGDRYDRVSYAVRATDGRVLVGDGDLPPPSGPLDASNVEVHRALINEEPVNVASALADYPGRPGDKVVVQVAETLNKRHLLVARLRIDTVLPQLIVLVCAILLVGYGLAKILGPMRKLQVSIDSRGSTDLTPLDPAVVPRELRSLIASINGLMARLASSIDVQRRFIADAAHQLRTPLAGLKSQTELALVERDPAAMRRSLERLAGGTERAIELANRLLTLARAGTLPTARTEVDLVALAQDAIADHLPTAYARQQDLGFEGPAAGSSVTVHGDALLLRELLSNLVDNAVRYAPDGGVITVTVDRDDNQVRLGVSDTGPGIPPDERGKVFEPFYRGRDAVPPGTGLGLAIVKTIAGAHGADVTLAAGPDERGLCVAVRFPASATYGA
jgi:two-component system, OmpR family, sensor histidine kinase TctE